MPSPGPDPQRDESGDLETPDAPGRRWFGATRPGALITLLVLVLVVLLFQRQLRESRQRSSRGRSNNVATVVDRDPSAAHSISSSSRVPRAEPPEGADRVPRAPDDGIMRGRLVDPLGRPVAAAEVRIGQQIERTGPDGRFDLPWAGGDLRATHPGFWTRELKRSSLVLLRELDRPDGDVPSPGPARENRLPVLVVPGARVSGTVRTDAGPASGARVLISTGQRRWEVLAEADGAFASPLLPATGLSLLVLYPGMLPSLTVLPPAAEDWNHRVEVDLKKGVPLKVRVEDERSRPEGDAEVWLRTVPRVDQEGPKPAVEWEFVGWTDDLGRVDAARSSHQPAQIQVRTPGYAVTIRPLLGPESHLRLRPAPSLRGTAVDAETGLPVDLRSAGLQVSRDGVFEDCPAHGQQTHTLGDGRFIVGLPPFKGLYRVLLRGAGNRAGRSDAVSFDGSAAPGPLLVSLDRRTVIAGCVRGPDGPVRGLRVELLSAPDPDAPARELHGVRVPPPRRVAGSEATDSEGRFEFSGRGPGLYRIHVQLDGLREYFSPVFCPPLDEELPIQLDRGAGLSGSLTSSDGRAETNVPLVLTDGDAVTRVARTDGSGAYEFRDLPGGRYRLLLGSSGRRRALGAVEMRELTIEEGRDLRFNMRRSPVPLQGE